MMPLNTLQQFQLADVSVLLSWLDSLAAPNVRRGQPSRRPPIQTGKLGAALAALVEFGFVREEEDDFVITPAGRSFLRSSPSAKRALVRALFLRDEQIRRVVDLLETSSGGRLPRAMVNESFTIGALGPVKDADVRSFIAWAEDCELFGYDRVTDEIVSLGRGLPWGPSERWVTPAFRGLASKAS